MIITPMTDLIFALLWLGVIAWNIDHDRRAPHHWVTLLGLSLLCLGSGIVMVRMLVMPFTLGALIVGCAIFGVIGWDRREANQ